MQSGSTFGSAFLIAGSSIGIGMLALPIVTGLAGFIPSVIIFLFCFLFMGATALLLSEVAATFPEGDNIISLAHNTLGKFGKALSWGAYLFLFYCLMIAYVSKGGDIVNHALRILPHSHVGKTVLALTSSLVIFFGKRMVDLINRLLIIGFFVSFVWMNIYGIQHVNVEYLKHREWTASLFALPFVITAFGFHNIIPSISDYLQQNRRKVTWAIAIGATISLIVYLFWEAVVQGSLPFDGDLSISLAYQSGQISTEILSLVANNPQITTLAFYLSFFAITTSILGQGLGLTEFLLDGLQFSRTKINRLLACLTVFTPALILASLYPHLFFILLELAGGVAAIILFGLMPPCMAHVCRSRNRNGVPFLPGGKVVLSTIAGIATLVFVYECYRLVTRLTVV